MAASYPKLRTNPKVKEKEKEMSQKGLNSFQIKVIALILMVFDHIHYIFSGIWDIPMWFTMLGRVSAPLFIFISANGMRYTRHPEKYMLRLWAGSVFMSFGNKLINTYFPLPGGGIVMNNIFSTLFISSLVIYCIRKIRERKREGQPFIRYLLLMSIPVVSSILIVLTILVPRLTAVSTAIMAFVPSLLFCEGSFAFVLLGVGFYFCLDSKKKLSLFYTLFCLFILFTGHRSGEGLQSVFTADIQWMMIFALPVMLLYNKQKGAGMKYFFYIFYPAHIYLFAILAFYCAGR